MDPITIGTAIGTSLITSFATKGESEPIKSLNDIWYLAFGRLQLFADQKRIKHEKFLESYKNELVKEISDIPDENLIEPPLSVVGPALDASKYYIEEEILRSMFAKIISSSMDNRKNSRTHHAFVEIIKQLSTLDAKNLTLFKNRKKFPIVNYGMQYGQKGYNLLHNHIMLENNQFEGSKTNASSLINLQRLGLLNIDYSKPLMDKTIYEPFKEHKLFLNLSNIITTEEFNENSQPVLDFLKMEHSQIHPKIEQGVIEVTPLGEDFLYTCL